MDPPATLDRAEDPRQDARHSRSSGQQSKPRAGGFWLRGIRLDPLDQQIAWIADGDLGKQHLKSRPPFRRSTTLETFILKLSASIDASIMISPGLAELDRVLDQLVDEIADAVPYFAVVVARSAERAAQRGRR